MMWNWIKEKLLELEPIITALGVIASVVIAYFAYNIDVKMQQNQRINSQVERAMNLAQSIIDADDFRELQSAAFEIEEATETRFKNGDLPDVDKPWKAAAAAVVAERMTPSLQTDIRHWIQHASRAEQCIDPDFGYAEKREQGRGPCVAGLCLGALLDRVGAAGPGTAEETRALRALCDQKSVLMLTGESFIDLYLQLRPALFCDQKLDANRPVLSNFVKQYLNMKEEREAARARAAGEPEPKAFNRRALSVFDDADGTYCGIYRDALASPPHEQAAMELR